MEIDLLTENHTLKDGDSVVVTERQYPKNSYRGTIYKIVSAPANKYIKPYDRIYVDYFYIRLNNDDLHKLCMRGLEVIYNHKPSNLGNIERSNGKITKLYTQDTHPFSSRETEINLSNINAILMWRVAYEIKHS